MPREEANGWRKSQRKNESRLLFARGLCGMIEMHMPHGNKIRTAKGSATFAKQYTLDFLCAMGKEVAHGSREKMGIKCTPPKYTLKINMDGVIFQAQEYYGIGVIIRGEDEEIYVSMVDCQRGIPSALVVEEYAIRMCIQLAQRSSFKIVISERDNEALVKALQNNNGERSKLGELLEDI